MAKKMGFVLWFGLFCLISRFAMAEETLLLGEQRSLPVKAGTRFSVGNTEVLQVKNTVLSDGRVLLLLKGRAAGYSDLMLFAPDAEQQKMAFRVVEKREQPKLMAKEPLNPNTALRMQKRIQERLQAAGLSTLHARSVGQTVFLEGIARTKQEKELAEILAHELCPGAHSYVRLPFDEKDILRFKVQILELAKSREDSVGLEWSDGIPGILQLHRGLLKGDLSLDASLHALARTGLVKILSEPEIALNAEGVAELKVGGEIPIALKALHFSYVQWKAYGLSLRLEVPGVASTKARTNIQVEMSTLDVTNGVDGVPATKLNRLETVVDLSLDKPIFLSGLMQNQSSEDVKAVPALADIPIFGALFRSKNFQERHSELVIALTARREE